MSSALVRQALEFVDEQDTGVRKRSKRAARHQKPAGQDTFRHPFKINNKKVRKQEVKSEQQIKEENIQKLLLLSKPTADASITEKIVERAIKGKPLAEKIEIKTENEKSILFPDEEPFKKFEKDYFCS